MTDQPQVCEETLQAYVDGALNAEDRATVEAFLADHPEEAARLAAYQHQNRELLALGGLLGRVAEDGGAQHNPVWEGRRRRVPPWLLRVTSIAAALLIGVAGGWIARDQTLERKEPLRQFTERVALAHRMYTAEVAHPVEVRAEQEKHLVAWLSKRVGRSLVAPSLQNLGFNLVGGRLLPTGVGAAAQFMYQNEAGQRITLYINRGVGGNQETAFRYQEADQVNMFYWLDEHVAYALAGPLDRDRLLAVSKAVYMQLEHL